jgi:hypothetical protein
MYRNFNPRIALASAAIALATLIGPQRGSAAGTDGAAMARPAHDGSHDFDFIYGKWRMPNHRLKERLANSHEFVDFIT